MIRSTLFFYSAVRYQLTKPVLKSYVYGWRASQQVWLLSPPLSQFITVNNFEKFLYYYTNKYMYIGDAGKIAFYLAGKVSELWGSLLLIECKQSSVLQKSE